MSGKGAVLALRIVSDARGATAGLRDTEKGVGSFTDKLDKASVASAGVLAGVGAIAKEAYQAASDLQQSGGAVETVFGRQSDAVKSYAKNAVQAVGLSTNAYQEQAATLGALLKNMGVGTAQLGGQTDKLIGLGADLAATYGGTTKDAVEALGSALKGETDPIERYGISIKQSTIAAALHAKGLDKLTGAAATQARTATLLGLVTQQAGGAVGAFARESDTAAGQSQRAAAAYENAKAALGDVLLPIVTKGAQELAGLAGWLEKNKTTTQVLVGVVGGLALAVLAVNAAVKVYRAIAVVATAAQWAWNVAMDANPIGLIVLAVAGVIAAVVLMYNKFAWFRNAVGVIAGVVKGYIQLWIDAISWVLDKLSFVKDIAGGIGDLFSAPVAVQVAGGGVSSFGAAAGGGAGGGVYGSPMSALAGGRSTVGQGSTSGPGTVVVNLSVGVGDPVELGRQLERILRQYAQATGSQVALTVGRAK